MEGARPNKKIRSHSKKKDIISRLPEEILHHILSSLSQKEASRTCVLSRAWRYIGCTRPKIEWTDFNPSMDRILQVYHRRNLGLVEFSLRLSVYWEGKAAWILRKWIPSIVQNMHVKTFRLIMGCGLFELPSSIVESDHIQNLSLQKCVLKSSSDVRVSLQLLQTLRLDKVYIPEEILNIILSKCPFLEDVSLTHCKGFTRIKLCVNNNNKPTKLAQFCFSESRFPHDHDVSIEIEDDSQTQTSIDTTECKPLESAQNRRQLCLESARLLSYSCSCNFTILELYDVYIPKRILDNILSYCPLIKNVSLTYCKGFETIEMLNNRPTRNLKHFCFHGNDDDHRVSIEIGNDIETLRSIDISHCLFFVSHNKQLKCARLTRLSLTRVQLSSDLFSCNLNCLEELKLKYCSDIKEFKLSSRSMKRLVIHNVNKPFKASIDAPSMISFHYEGVLPQSISFATTYSHWKSNISLGSSVDGHDHCFYELYDLLEASSQSEVNLELGVIDIREFGTQIHIRDNRLPIAVEHLRIKRLARKPRSSAAPFLNMLFRMFRPSFLYMGTEMLINSNNKNHEMAEFLFKKREPALCYFWQRVLEGGSLQVKCHWKQREWQPVEHTSFRQVSKKSRELKYRIHLKWRDN